MWELWFCWQWRMRYAVSGEIKNLERAVPAAVADAEGAPAAGRKTDSDCPGKEQDSGIVPAKMNI